MTSEAAVSYDGQTGKFSIIRLSGSEVAKIVAGLNGGTPDSIETALQKAIVDDVSYLNDATEGIYNHAEQPKLPF